ncbi:hypothetical protein [Kordiimonas pumila]|uniref:HEAT repeat domain-containing protein n=1 Tax=Kordiimonas pumila TaxID=2161677 RepID=A0ABV7D4I0_9PROT|nr:hypothetical protein [Kordiimonas pumila]
MLLKKHLKWLTSLSFALLFGCNEKDHVQGQPVDLITAVLEESLTDIPDWQDNDALTKSMLYSYMAAEQCTKAVEVTKFLLNPKNKDTLDHVSAAKKHQQLTAGFKVFPPRRTPGPCFDDVAKTIYGNMEVFLPTYLDAASGVLEEIAETYRRFGEDEKAEGALSLIHTLPWPIQDGVQTKRSSYRSLLPQVTAFYDRGEKDQAVSLLKKIWFDELPNYQAPSGYELEYVAREALRLREYALYFKMIEGYEKSKWVNVNSNIYTKDALLHAPTDIAYKIVALSDPKNRSKSKLPIFFEKYAYENPSNIKEIAPNLFKWIMDPLRRARAQAFYGGWLGHGGDTDGKAWCETAPKTAKLAEKYGSKPDEFHEHHLIRALGFCAFGTGGISSVQALAEQRFSNKYKSAIAGGASVMALHDQDWDNFTELLKLTINTDEQHLAWLNLLNIVQNNHSYTVPVSVVKLLNEQIKRHKKQLARTQLQKLQFLISPYSEQIELLTNQLKSAQENEQHKLRLKLASTIHQSGDKAAAMEILEELSEQALMSQNPQQLIDVISNIGQMGSWPRAVSILKKAKDPNFRAQASILLLTIVDTPLKILN